MENSMGGGALGSIAASFGFDLSDMQTSDAITPLLYPDLMDDNGFVTSMFDIKVEDSEGEIKTTYYDYLKNHQKDAWFKYPLHWIKELLPKDADSNEENVAFDPYDLSRADNDIAEAIRGNIKISIDKKTGVITIVTKAQDKLICKTLADSVMSQLQEFIIDYRTNKARNDYEYYKKLVADAKSDYETVRRKYGATSDANMEVTMKSMELLLTDLENDMQLKFNTYTTMCTQLEAAKAKVQDRTPAFTIIEGAAVPVKPAGPKRMIFVIGMMFLTFIGTAFYITKKDFHFSF
jgi:capsule polysaccharide export protein KpsE/RkpR